MFLVQKEGFIYFKLFFQLAEICMVQAEISDAKMQNRPVFQTNYLVNFPPECKKHPDLQVLQVFNPFLVGGYLFTVFGVM